MRVCVGVFVCGGGVACGEVVFLWICVYVCVCLCRDEYLFDRSANSHKCRIRIQFQFPFPPFPQFCSETKARRTAQCDWAGLMPGEQSVLCDRKGNLLCAPAKD